MSPAASFRHATEIYEEWRCCSDPSGQGSAKSAFDQAVENASLITKVAESLLRLEILKRSPLYASARRGGNDPVQSFIFAMNGVVPIPLYLSENSDPESAR